MPTAGSLFSGGGLADVGLRAAGYDLVFAVEHDPAIAAVYRQNLGDHVIVAGVQDVDPHTLPPVELLWCSPPCPGFSQARDKSLGPHGSEELGLAIIPYLEILTPRVVLIENVPPYVHSDVFVAIVVALYRLGYMVDWSNINAANYAVPQTRNRLILRACRDSLLPPLPAPVPWIGWYAAIEDILHTLPDSQFAEWQLERLKNHAWAAPFLAAHGDDKWGDGYRLPELPAGAVTVSTATHQQRAYLVEDSNARDDAAVCIIPRIGEDPAFTVRAGPGGGARALLVHPTEMRNDTQREGGPPAFMLTAGGMASHTTKALLVSGTANDHGGTITAVREDDPSFTVTASSGDRHAVRPAQHGRVVAMTPRALARFQSVPDWYQLPEKRSLACKILGNGVPCLLVQRLAEQFRGDG